MSATPGSQASSTVSSQKCSYCGGTGKWVKEILVGKPPESVNCPHCHGSGVSGQSGLRETALDD